MTLKIMETPNYTDANCPPFWNINFVFSQGVEDYCEYHLEIGIILISEN